jgi:nucleoid-associated protein EbfC
MTMFEKLGQIASLMKNLPKMQEEMGKLQSRVAQITAEGDAGGGMVKAKVNGHMEVTACVISAELMAMNDKELMEDLIRASINQAIQKAKQAVAEETAKMAQGFGMPGGMQLPSS